MQKPRVIGFIDCPACFNIDLVLWSDIHPGYRILLCQQCKWLVFYYG